MYGLYFGQERISDISTQMDPMALRLKELGYDRGGRGLPSISEVSCAPAFTDAQI